MPGELSLRQRLTGFDGRPTRHAKLAFAAFAALAFALGFVVHPGGAEPSPAVPAASVFEGDVTTASGAAAAAPGLRSAAALPSLRRPATPARRAPAKQAEPAATAVPVATTAPAAEATPEPAAATPPPAAAPAPAPAPPPPNPSPSNETFDSAG